MENVTDNINNLPSLVWRGNLVVTTSQLAEFFGVPVNNISHNFNRNKEQFTEGVHYFKVQGDSLSHTLGKIFPCKVRSLNLFTKRGAYRLAKSINTERAWEIYNLLEANYFDRQVDGNAPAGTTPTAENFSNTALSSGALTCTQKVDALLRCAAATDNPKLRDSIIRKAVEFILS